MLAPTGLLAGPFSWKPKTEAIKIWIKEDCARHGIDDSKLDGHSWVTTKQLKESDRDVLAVRVQSECRREQKVAICPKRPVPLTCAGDPTDATVGTPFVIRAARNGEKVKSYIVCTMKWPTEWPANNKVSYDIKLYFDAEVPAKCPTGIMPMDHELMLEVVP